MTDLTGLQIAVLCDVAEGNKIPADRAEILNFLVANGFAEKADATEIASHKLTGRGQQFLTERGAGLNEA